MIKANKPLITYIETQRDKEELAKKWSISLTTIYSILKGNHIESETIASILNDTGFEFEKAFEIKE